MLRLSLTIAVLALTACASPKKTPPTSPCQTDADCRAIDDYCYSCSCLVATADYEYPSCSGEVQCRTLAPLCFKRVAVCVDNTCELRTETADAGP